MKAESNKIKVEGTKENRSMLQGAESVGNLVKTFFSVNKIII